MRGTKLKPPCMIVVQYVLPAIRVLIMKDLIKKHNMRKIDASAKMELTPAAITLYTKGKRGATFVDEITKSEKTMKILSELTETLAKDNMPTETIIDKLCRACVTIRSEGIICGLHQKELHALKESKCRVCEPSNADCFVN
jgi:predicted transcriptional regulator